MKNQRVVKEILTGHLYEISSENDCHLKMTFINLAFNVS